MNEYKQEQKQTVQRNGTYIFGIFLMIIIFLFIRDPIRITVSLKRESLSTISSRAIFVNKLINNGIVRQKGWDM